MGNKESKLQNELKELKELSNSYKESNQFELVISCNERVLQIDPKDTSASNNMGYAYFNLKKYL